MKAKTRRPPIKMIDVGAGWLEGPAVRFARQLERKNLPGRVIAVEMMNKPEYQTPSNMTYIQGDALTYLERAPPNIAQSITDDFFFHHTIWGKGGTNEVLKTIRKAQQATKGFTQMPDLMRNQSRYIKNVRKVLVPGGKFLITTGEEQVPTITPFLQEAGFKVTSRELKPEEVNAKGSRFAKQELEEGRKVIRIIAQKPK